MPLSFCVREHNERKIVYVIQSVELNSTLPNMFRNQRYWNDRFIPRRAGIDMDAVNYVLLNTSGSSIESPPSSQEKYFNKAYTKWQRKMFRERIWTNVTVPRRILSFTESNRVECKKKIQAQMWPVHARNKPLLASPIVVLDMPLLEGNIYDNSTDLSNSGHVAAVFRGEVFLWHSAYNNNIHESITCTGGKVKKCVSWNKNIPTLAIALEEKLVSIYACQYDKIVKEIYCACLITCTVSAMEWTKKNFLIAGCTSGQLTVFDSNLKVVEKVYKAHDGSIIKITLSFDEMYLATTGEDKNVRIWYWPSLKEHFQITYPSPVRGISWHPWRSAYLAIGGGYGEGSVTIWNACNFTEIGYKSPQDKKAISIDNLTWNPLSGELVISYWLEKNGIETSSIVVLSNLTDEVDGIEWHTGRVLFLLWGNDGTTLATVGADESLCMWEFLGNSSDVKKIKSMQQKRKIANDVFETTKIFGHCIR